jgi:dihydrofolate reductase
MGKLIVSEFVSLDGVVEAPGGEPTHPHTGWVIEHTSPEQIDYKMKETFEAEAMLLGRVTYEGFAASWPHRDGEFADKINSMPKYVVSSTLAEPLEWHNSTLVKGDLAKEVTRLKEGSDGPILVAGSATLVRALIEHDLVDELRLMVFPVMIGGGLRAFPESRQKKLFELTDVTRFPTGVAVHTYRPASAPLAEDGAQALRDVGVDVDRMRATTRDS